MLTKKGDLKMKSKIKLLTALSIATLIVGCTTNPETGQSQVSKAAVYGGIGTLGGAVVGAAAGGKKGAMIGAVAGGATGAGYGVYSDIQEKKLREELRNSGIEIRKEGKNIILTMPGNITFESGNANMSSSFYGSLNAISKTLKEYNKSAIQIVGHTDNTGNSEKNQILSERRAMAVADYLISQGISPQRVHHYGLGARSPIADNSTEYGRQTNRRVEVEIKN